MPHKKIIEVALDAAARHQDNAAIQSIVRSLKSARAIASSKDSDPLFQLDGYRHAITGNGGYDLMLTLERSPFDRVLRAIGSLHEVGIITIVLIDALNSVGEEIVY